jgi:hypothetical protein
VLLASPVEAAISVVRDANGAGNDATVTFGAAPSASNVVLVISSILNEAQTLDITGWPNAEVVLADVNSPGDVNRMYAWCMVGDGADLDFVVTSSGSGSALTVAVEIWHPSPTWRPRITPRQPRTT